MTVLNDNIYGGQMSLVGGPCRAGGQLLSVSTGGRNEKTYWGFKLVSVEDPLGSFYRIGGANGFGGGSKGEETEEWIHLLVKKGKGLPGPLFKILLVEGISRRNHRDTLRDPA